MARALLLTAMASLAAAASAAASAGATVSYRDVPPPPRIAAALDGDGYDVVRAITVNGTDGVAYYGVSGVSRTVLLNGTVGKTILVVEGDGRTQGVLTGLLAEPAVDLMSTTFLLHIVPDLLFPSLDPVLQNSSLAPLYDALLALLDDLLIGDAQQWWNASVAAGAIPAPLIDELAGLVDGCTASNASTAVSLPRLIALNFAYDMLLGVGGVGRATGGWWE